MGAFEFRDQSEFSSKLFFFPESDYICIYETRNANDKTGVLNFAKYPAATDAKLNVAWRVELENCFNFECYPLNLKDRLVLFNGTIGTDISWKVYDLISRKVEDYSVKKP